MIEIFKKMEKCGLVKTVFPGGEIKTEEDWIKFSNNPANVISKITVNGKIKGVMWLTGIQRNHAYGHFCFFPPWGHSLRYARIVLRQWFKSLDIIMGMIPCSNIKAQKFTEALGFKKLAIIPKVHYDAYKSQYGDIALYWINKDISI
jgi:hypothetical protein